MASDLLTILVAGVGLDTHSNLHQKLPKIEREKHKGEEQCLSETARSLGSYTPRKGRRKRGGPRSFGSTLKEKKGEKKEGPFRSTCLPNEWRLSKKKLEKNGKKHVHYTYKGKIPTQVLI